MIKDYNWKRLQRADQNRYNELQIQVYEEDEKEKVFGLKPTRLVRFDPKER